MSQAALLSAQLIEDWRKAHYNAEVTSIRMLHKDLMIMRVRLDTDKLEYEAGQYTVLGLGYWEPRVSNSQEEELSENHISKLIKRAYSISSPILADGTLVRPSEEAEVEFYITLVRKAAKPPALTPRLFALSPGDRLFVGPRPHGHYSLEGVEPEDNVIFAATGTGEAPHNAMTAELLSRGHKGKIVSLCCVRYKQDLGYLSVHRELESRFPNYRYIGLTTREPENLDPSLPNYVGKQYIQDYFQSGRFEKETGIQLLPEHVRVFLCGNPAMIGIPLHTHDPAHRYPKPTGMVEILESVGFEIDRPHHPGTIHFEKYW